MKRLNKYFLICLLLWFPSLSLANQWKVDPAHAGINFTVKHIFSMVTGHFTDFEADIVFDPADLDKSKLDFSVKVKSIYTFNAKRDGHLRSKDFFDADKFPVMSFKSTKITHKKDNIYHLEGEMTIKDVTEKINLEFIFHGTKISPFNKKELVAGFDTYFTIDRMQYGVGNGKFYKMGIVGKQVNVSISLEAIREP